jgi:hypothetical protein
VFEVRFGVRTVDEPSLSGTSAISYDSSNKYAHVHEHLLVNRNGDKMITKGTLSACYTILKQISN